MRPQKRATLALPLAIVAAALLVPLLAGRTEAPKPVAAAGGGEGIYSGRTAKEWERRAERALDGGRYREAIAFLKSAERADLGEQYGERLHEARRGRWAAGEVARLKERLLGSEISELAFDDELRVVSGHRTTVALPGESLWSIARATVAAEMGVLPGEVGPSEADVFACWDALTRLNGVRELEVGEEVLLPLRAADRVRLAAAKRRRVERGAELAQRAMAAADSGAFVLAEELVADAVALGADPAVIDAVDERRAAHEERLVEEASRLVADALRSGRLAEYGKLVSSLERARELLTVAEELAPGTGHDEELERVSALLAEASRYRVRPDGVVIVTKPAGVGYTEAARTAVEWLIERRIASSGRTFPDSDGKTADELAWARLLRDAYDRARDEGVDFEELLEAEEAAAEFALPNPAGYFVVAADREERSAALK